MNTFIWLKMFYKLIIILYLSLISITHCNTKQLPNVIIFIADDMGWADVGYHSDHVLTPNIDTLAADGIVLNHYYTHPVSCPSRAALLTGVHPIHTGLQNFVIINRSPTGLPLHYKLLPQYLKQHNYATHIVGKWHLGYARREFTPTYRGFDSHVGFWGYNKQYFNHTACDTWPDECGLDSRHNMTFTTDGTGVYSTHYFTDRCLHIIDGHNSTHQPLFLYMPYQALHAARAKHTVAPQNYIDMFAYIASDKRRRLAAMAYSVDESVGLIVDRLHSKGMLDNSIIVFASDNGAHPDGNGGSNWPFRGNKTELFEGALRVPAFIWSPLLRKSGYVSEALIDVSDITPTILDAIGDRHVLSDETHIYGVSQWDTMSHNGLPVRSEIIHNIDPVDNMSAIRWHDWKLVLSSSYKGWDVWTQSIRFGSWAPPMYTNPMHSREQFETMRNLHRHHCKIYKVLSQMNRQPNYDVLDESTVRCSDPPVPNGKPECLTGEMCLFNLRVDPCEYKNIINETDPSFVRYVWHKLVEFNETSVPALSLVPLDKRAHPRFHNNTWTNWLDDDLDYQLYRDYKHDKDEF